MATENSSDSCLKAPSTVTTNIAQQASAVVKHNFIRNRKGIMIENQKQQLY